MSNLFSGSFKDFEAQLLSWIPEGESFDHTSKIPSQSVVMQHVKGELLSEDPLDPSTWHGEVL